jgi:hypothetical protein
MIKFLASVWLISGPMMPAIGWAIFGVVLPIKDGWSVYGAPYEIIYTAIIILCFSIGAEPRLQTLPKGGWSLWGSSLLRTTIRAVPTITFFYWVGRVVRHLISN